MPMRPIVWITGVLSLAAATLQNPVMPGDHPDPSVIRFGNEYLGSQHLFRLGADISALVF